MAHSESLIYVFTLLFQPLCHRVFVCSDDVQVKTSLSPLLPKKPQPTDKTGETQTLLSNHIVVCCRDPFNLKELRVLLRPPALCSLHSVSGPSVSIQTELAVEQLKTKQQQELQELHVQLETRVAR